MPIVSGIPSHENNPKYSPPKKKKQNKKQKHKKNPACIGCTIYHNLKQLRRQKLQIM